MHNKTKRVYLDKKYTGRQKQHEKTTANMLKISEHTVFQGFKELSVQFNKKANVNKVKYFKKLTKVIATMS